MTIFSLIQELFSLGDYNSAKLGGAMRNDGWSKASRDFINEHPLCEMGLHKPTLLNILNTHHVIPFNKRPDLEMLESNWIVLCRFHHFIHAHLRNWSSSNPNIREDCDLLNKKIHERT